VMMVLLDFLNWNVIVIPVVVVVVVVVGIEIDLVVPFVTSDSMSSKTIMSYPIPV